MLFKKPENKRQFPRADFFQASYFMIPGTDMPATMECWCNNISEGGISFDCDRNDLGDNVIRVLYKIGSLYRKDDLKIRHASRLLSRWQYGCEFISADDQRDAVIGSYVGAKLER